MNPLLDLVAGPLIEGVGKIIDRVVPDKNAAEKAKQEMAVMVQTQDFQLALQQVIVNLEEAKHQNIFVSGWRPFVGWVCGVALAYAAILEPVMRFVAKTVFEYRGAFPVIDTMLTLQVLLGLLGLGALRTREKEKGVARSA